MAIACQNVDILAVGSISISSTPTGARIWLAPTGQTLIDQIVDTNATISNLVVGSYDIKLVKSGYQDWTTTVSVTDGGTATVNATLILTTGSASFSSTPSGAEIFIDDVDQGVTTPRTITGLVPGNHSYKLTNAGYAEATGTFSIVANTETPVSVTFAGSAYITSTPSGARIWLNGGDTGVNTPAIITGLTAGSNAYSLVLVGRDATTGNFTAIAGQTVNVPVTLLTPPSIEAQSIDVTPSDSPCIEGICTIGVEITWINNGESSGTFVPNINVDNVPASPIWPSTAIGPYPATITRTFTVTGLLAAAHTICPNPNTPV